MSSINNLTLFRGLNNEFDCVTLSETQINNIPPSCLDLGIPDNFNPQDPNQEACYGWELVDLSNSYDYTSTWVLDEGVSFSLSCGAVKTNIPDDNFEQALIDLGYDDVMDDYVLTSNINEVTALEISDKNISDLTGIEDFLALQDLFLKNNSVSVLDLSNNINLLQLDADFNGITSLDVSNSSNLNYITAGWNNLTSIDLSSNTNLTSLQLTSSGPEYTNQIASIDLSNNTLLTYLSLGNLDITSIDLSNNLELNHLYINENQLQHYKKELSFLLVKKNFFLPVF